MDQNKIQNDPQKLFKSNCTKWYEFLDKITTPELTSEKANVCEGDLVERALFKSLRFM